MAATIFAEEALHTEGTAVLLAIDDHCIPWARSIYLEMNRPVKCPENPIVPRGLDGACDGWRAGAPAVVRNGSSWRMWYVARPQMHGNHAIHIGYAESGDGLTWDKPELGLVELNGSHANNLVAAAPGLNTCSVLLDEDAPPERRYVMIGEDMTDFERWGHDVPSITRIDVSADGLRWRKLTDSTTFAQIFEPATIYKFKGRYHIGGHQNGDVLRLPMQAQDLGHYLGPRTFVVSRSPTLDAWPTELVHAYHKPMQSSSPYRQGWDREEVHLGAGVTPYNNVCVGVYGQWHHPINDGDPVYDREQPSVDLGLVISSDGLHFREPAPGFTWIARDQELAWGRGWQGNTTADNLLLCQGSLVNTEDETLIYYSASSPGGNVHEVSSNIGMARLPRDRFGYLRLMSSAETGWCSTCPLQVGRGASVSINAVVPVGSRLRLSVLDEDGLEELPGYGVEDSCSIATSGLERPVTWGELDELPPDRKLRLRVQMEGDVELYAIYLHAAG